MVMQEMVSPEAIEQKIFLIRVQKVMVDKYLAELYGVKTKRLNEKREEHEQSIAKHDGEIVTIFEAIRQLMASLDILSRKIGYTIAE